MEVAKTNVTTHDGTRATLHLNGTPVGGILVKGWHTSWTYGEFEPLAAFGKFAPIFGRWSLLMHDDEGKPITSAAAFELREAERDMDSIRVRIHFSVDDTWRDIGQLNIDGTLIEWKEV